MSNLGSGYTNIVTVTASMDGKPKATEPNRNPRPVQSQPGGIAASRK
jgi:hypothetical protein